MFVLAQAVAFAGAGIGAFFYLVKIHNELELKCEKWFVLAGATAAHSPLNHHGADPMIEEFVQLYVNGNHDMSAENWVRFQHFWFDLEHNPKANASESLCARGFRELCEHKMRRDKTIDQAKR